MIFMVEMKDKRLYKGIKGGSEGGLLYLFNPFELSEDEKREIDGYWESPVGEKIGWNANSQVSFMLIPIADIERMTSVSN